MLEWAHIAANKNTVPGDVSAMVPGGIRMGTGFCFVLSQLLCSEGQLLLRNSFFFFHVSGTPALTSRGFVEQDFAKVAEFFDTAVKLALKIKVETKGLA